MIPCLNALDVTISVTLKILLPIAKLSKEYYVISKLSAVNEKLRGNSA